MGRPVGFGLALGEAEEVPRTEGSGVSVEAGRPGSGVRRPGVAGAGRAAPGVAAVAALFAGSTGNGTSIGASSLERHAGASAATMRRRKQMRRATERAYAEREARHLA